MTASRKAGISLLISILLFVFLDALTFIKILDMVEVRFYTPKIVRSLLRETERMAESSGIFLNELKDSFSVSLQSPEVRESLLPPSGEFVLMDEAIQGRDRIYQALIEAIDGLFWVLFIGEDGRTLYYSTRKDDFSFSPGNSSLPYRSYGEDPGDPPYIEIASVQDSSWRLLADRGGSRLFFSFPWRDSRDQYGGTALFCLSLRALRYHLLQENLLTPGETAALIPVPLGLVTGVSANTGGAILDTVSRVWRSGDLGLNDLGPRETGIPRILVSARSSQGFLMGRLVNETVLLLPRNLKLLLLASIFLTLYLIVFLLFNLRQDTLTVIKGRVQNLRMALSEEYLDRKENRGLPCQELDRGELKRFLERGLPVKPGDEADSFINAFLERLFPPRRQENPPSLRIIGKYEPLEEEALEELEEVDEDPGRGEAASGYLEELESPEELEELESLEDERPSVPAMDSPPDMDSLASRIEFADLPEEEAASLDMNLEIKSPFADILSSLEDDGEGGKILSPGAGETLRQGIPLVSRPFSAWDQEDPHPLVPPGEEPAKDSIPTDLAVEIREGIPFVREDILSPDRETEKNLDRTFKSLVDLVT